MNTTLDHPRIEWREDSQRGAWYGTINGISLMIISQIDESFMLSTSFFGTVILLTVDEAQLKGEQLLEAFLNCIRAEWKKQ